MILSVVIPTYNKKEMLARTLSALAQQRVACDWEIVVVDDGSTDGTDELLAARSGEEGSRLRVAKPGRNLGRAGARNLGIQSARGRWVLFLDDDIVVPADLLSAHLALLQENPGCGTIGCVRTAPELIDAPHFSYLDSRGVAKQTGGLVPARYFVTQNAAVPREALLAVGGFSTEYSAYGMEDMEVAFRLEDQLGLCFLALRQPVPTHVHHHTLAEYLAKKQECGEGSLPPLARHHPHRIREMKLHWVIDSATGKPGFGAAGLVRALGRGFPGRLLRHALERWPVHKSQAPRWRRLYFRLMDLQVLFCYGQGLDRRRP